MTSEKIGIYFIVAAVVIVALAGLAFAVAGPVAGLIVIVCLVVGFFIGRSRVERERGQVEVAVAPADDVTRLLVIAHEGLGDERLVSELSARADGETHVHVVVPALASAADRLAGDQAALDAAGADLERCSAGSAASSRASTARSAIPIRPSHSRTRCGPSPPTR